MIRAGCVVLLAAPVCAGFESAPLLTREILAVRRVHVERLSGGETANQIRDMIITSLQKLGLFVLTENPERADAILRGSGEDLVYTDSFQSSEGLQARATANIGSSSSSSRTRGVYGHLSVGENESTRISERRHEAVASVRLVNKDGDVLWSTTQQSYGAKFLTASADVADKIARQLADDYQRLRQNKPSPGGP